MYTSTQYVGFSNSWAPNNSYTITWTGAYGKPIGTNTQNKNSPQYVSVGITPDYDNSGMEVFFDFSEGVKVHWAMKY